MKALGLVKARFFLAAASATLMLSACGYNPMTAPGASPYGTGYGTSSYNQYGQANYAQTGGDPNAAYNQAGNYGQSSFAALPSDAGAYPSAQPSGAPNAGGFGYQMANPYLSNPPGQPSATPKPAPTPVDKAPDPIAPAQFNQISDDLAVLTYNVWGLPGILGTKRSERFSRLGSTLNAYDVVTLQGAYSDEIETLKQSTGFNFHARINNSSLLKTNSGLYTLSKYPILKTEYFEFDHCSGTDCLTRKGILLTRVEHPKIGPVDIYSVNYQAGDSAKAKDIRSQHDNRELQEMIQRNKSSYPVIVMGDFEMVPAQTEYNDLMSRMPLTDAFSKLHPNEGGYTLTPDNPYQRNEGVPMRIDYIFLLKTDGIQITPLETRVAYTEPVDGYVLSNHYGVSARLQIKVTKK